MEYGWAAIKPQQTSTDEENKFSPSPPSFKPPTIPSHADYLTIAEKDHTPSPAIVDRIRAKGNDRLAQLLEQAKSNAKSHAKTLDRTTVKSVSQPIHKHPRKQVEYCEAHILSDDQFIRITRDMTVEKDKRSLKPLVLANGGMKYMERGYTLASAFDCVKREVQARLHHRETEKIDYRGMRGWAPGTPTQKDRFTKMKQAQVIHKEDDQ